MDAFGWRLYPWFRVLVLGMLLVFAVIGITFLARPPGDMARWWGVAYLAIISWNAYWFGFRIVYRLEVEDGTLSWSTALRSGQHPVEEAVAIRQGGFGLPVIHGTGWHLDVLNGPGFGQFAEALRAKQPALLVELQRVPARAFWLGGGFYTGTER